MPSSHKGKEEIKQDVAAASREDGCVSQTTGSQESSTGIHQDACLCEADAFEHPMQQHSQEK